MKLTSKSLDNLKGVNPRLVAVVQRASELTPVEFQVTEGLRDIGRQQKLLNEKKTQTLNSKHLTGHAVDVCAIQDGKVCWDWPLYEKINEAFQQAAKELKTNIQWGGAWKTLKDGPHFELVPPYLDNPKLKA